MHWRWLQITGCSLRREPWNQARSSVPPTPTPSPSSLPLALVTAQLGLPSLLSTLCPDLPGPWQSCCPLWCLWPRLRWLLLGICAGEIEGLRSHLSQKGWTWRTSWHCTEHQAPEAPDFPLGTRCCEWLLFQNQEAVWGEKTQRKLTWGGLVPYKIHSLFSFKHSHWAAVHWASASKHLLLTMIMEPWKSLCCRIYQSF